MSLLLEFGTDILVTPPGFVDKPGETVFEIALAAGDAFVRTPVKFRADADFIATSMKASLRGTASGLGTAFTFQFTDSEARYLSNQQGDFYLAAGTAMHPYFFGFPLYYPAGSISYFDITAVSPVGSAIVQIVFIGVRRFRGEA